MAIAPTWRLFNVDIRSSRVPARAPRPLEPERLQPLDGIRLARLDLQHLAVVLRGLRPIARVLVGLSEPDQRLQVPGVDLHGALQQRDRAGPVLLHEM